jgi:hypothetical protein
MPLYMDVHRDMNGVTAEELAAAHLKDQEVQGKHGVEYLKYWYDANAGAVFCLGAPSKEAAEAVHREAHGHVATEIFEVQEGA